MSIIDTTATLRQHLMSDRALDRVHGLYALELQQGRAAPALARELEAFVERGTPYYAPDDLSYQAWVAKALALWDRVQASPRATRRRTQGAAEAA